MLFHRPTRDLRRAFTLVEVLVSLAVIGISASSLIWGLGLANKSAILGRVFTGATAAAQQQIDLVLTDSPFSPGTGQFLAELPDSSGGVQTAIATVPIYQETSTSSPITGTMTTKVEDTNATYNSFNTTDLNIYRITVSVAFNFRGKPYTVQLATMRAPDS